MTGLDAFGVLLFVLFVACAIASPFIGFFTPAGTVCNWIGWISLLLLIILAIFGSRLQRRTVYVPRPGSKAAPRTVATASGGVTLVGGSPE